MAKRMFPDASSTRVPVDKVGLIDEKLSYSRSEQLDEVSVSGTFGPFPVHSQLASQVRRNVSHNHTSVYQKIQTVISAMGYNRSRWKTALVYLVSFASLGIPLLFAYWLPRWKMRWMFVKAGLVDCRYVLAEAPDHTLTLCHVSSINPPRTCAQFSRVVGSSTHFLPMF